MKPIFSCVAAALLCLLVSFTSLAADVAGRVTSPTGEPVEHAIVFLKAGSVPAPTGERPPAVMDQVDKEFIPHVLPIVTGTPVRFPNHDQIHHHVYSFSRLMSFDLPLYRSDEPPPIQFDRPGVVLVGCNIHDWMSGVIVVLPNEYFAITDASGAFTLKDVPPGSHTLLAWHERNAAKVDETAQVVDVGTAAVSDLRFTLPLLSPQGRTRENGERADR